YKDYFNFTEPARQIPPHRILALNRGEREHALRVSLEWNADAVRAASLRALGDSLMRQASLPQPVPTAPPPTPPPAEPPPQPAAEGQPQATPEGQPQAAPEGQAQPASEGQVPPPAEGQAAPAAEAPAAPPPAPDFVHVMPAAPVPNDGELLSPDSP